MKPAAPLKSAFTKMTPSVMPLAATSRPPEAEKKPATEPKPKPSQTSAEIWAEVVERLDRQVTGWIYMGKCRTQVRPHVVTLNLHHPLVRQAIDQQDDRLLAWIGSIPLAEYLLTHKLNPLSAETLRAIRESLMAPEQRSIHGVMFLAQTIAGWQPFENLGSELRKRLQAGERLFPIGSIPLQPEGSKESCS
jgi:hypothetical protein